MNLTKIRTFEAITICVIVVLNKIILNPTKTIIYATGSSSILNMLYVCLFVALIGWLICKVFAKFPNSDILDVSSYCFGKGFTRIYAFAFWVFFLFVAAISVRSFVENLKMFYPEGNDIRLLILFFLVAACLANLKGAGSVGRISAFITPLTAIGITITFLSVMGLFNWNRIFPLFGYGLNQTFLLGVSNIYAFSSLSVLYFLPPLLEKQKDFQKVTTITLVITAILLIFSITSMILALSFSFTSSALSPMYLVIRSIEWGSFFESPEAIFTFIFILSMICFLAVLIMVCLSIVSKMGTLSNGRTLAFSLGEIIFGISLLPKDIPSINFLEAVVYKYFSLILVFGISIIVLLVGYWKRKKKGGKLSNEAVE